MRMVSAHRRMVTRPRDISPRNQAHVDIDPASRTVPLSLKVQEWSAIMALSLACGKALCHQGRPGSEHRQPVLCRTELRGYLERKWA